ncbi:membrane protein [Streptomyces narbonensis]
MLAWVLLGEHLDAPQILGGALVLVGAFIAQSSTPKAPPSDPVAASGGDGAKAADGRDEKELSAGRAGS